MSSTTPAPTIPAAVLEDGRRTALLFTLRSAAKGAHTPTTACATVLAQPAGEEAVMIDDADAPFEPLTLRR